MPIQLTEEHRRRIEEFRARHKTGVLTLVFTDMVGSTDLKRVLGDASGTTLIQEQQAVVREALSQFEEAEEISTAGDSFFITFIRPSDAVRFSLQVHSALAAISKTAPSPILLRIGVHMGEVFIETGEEALKKRDILGIQVDAASRVMLLAIGGQTLMTRSVFDNARAVLRGEDIEGLGVLAWMNHGYFKAEGVEEPFEICEVGEEGKAPLSPPPSRGKVQRFIIPDLEPVIGWQPALELEVPTAPGWILREKVGAGGFGEVWRAHHKTLKEDRVFKFCFHADRVRSLRREVALFRLLRQKVGDHPNIVRIHDVYFEDPPYYIVMEHVHAKDLVRWCDEKGGVRNVPFETRIRIVIEVAEALQAAHESGVIHRDVKPTNILVSGHGETPDDVQVKLTDFGIGEVLPEQLSGLLTTAGFTDVGLQTELSSRTGTRVYMAPEILAGRTSTPKSDLYSLGVVLYQLTIEDLAQPVTTDWNQRVDDPVIAEDISRCFAGNPESRFSSVAELARNLRRLPERRAKMEEEREARAAAEEAKRQQTLERQRETRKASYLASIVQAARNVRDLRFSEARELLASCPAERRCWEWGRLQYECNLDRMTLKEDDASPMICITVSPDGRLLATGGESRTVILWDFVTGSEVLRLPTQHERVDSVCFHPDGERIAVGTGDGSLSLWNLKTAGELFRVEKHTSLVDSLAFSRDGQRLASGSWDGSARIWKVETGQSLEAFEAHSPLRVIFNEEGQCLALGTLDGRAHIWDVGKGEQRSVLKGSFPGFGILAAAFSPDARLVTTGGRDGTARVWDVATGEERLHVKGHRETVRALAFDRDSKRLITGSADRTARVWNLEAGHEHIALNGHGDSVNCVAFGPDSSQPVTAGADGAARVWGVETCNTCTRLERFDSNVWSVAFSPDGKRLATGSGEGVWDAEGDNTARIWDLASREEILTLDGHTSNVWSVAFHPLGGHLLTASADQTAKVWDLQNGQSLKTLKGHEGFVLAAAFSPDGNLACTTSRDATARLWDWKAGSETRVLQRHSGPVSDLAFHPQGEILVTGSWDKTAKIWEVGTGQEIRTLSGHTDSVEAVAIGPDGSKVATGGKDNSIRIWDLKTGEWVHSAFESPSSITSIAFSPDGRRILAGCGDNTAKIWDVESGKVLLSLIGHDSFVVSVAFSPDGRLVATGGCDRTAILWPAFPWRDEDLPGLLHAPVEERIELVKRGLRKP